MSGPWNALRVWEQDACRAEELMATREITQEFNYKDQAGAKCAGWID